MLRSLQSDVEGTPFEVLLQNKPIRPQYFHALVMALTNSKRISPQKRRVFVERYNLDGKGYRTFKEIGDGLSLSLNHMRNEVHTAIRQMLQCLETLKHDKDLSILGDKYKVEEPTDSISVVPQAAE